MISYRALIDRGRRSPSVEGRAFACGRSHRARFSGICKELEGVRVALPCACAHVRAGAHMIITPYSPYTLSNHPEIRHFLLPPSEFSGRTSPSILGNIP